MRLLRKNVEGFTVLELMMVVSVISFLSILVLPGVTSARKKALNTKCISNQRVIWQAVNRYEFDFNTTLFTIRNNGVMIRNVLTSRDYVTLANTFECPLSQVKDNDDILLLYNGLDFDNTRCSMFAGIHNLQ